MTGCGSLENQNRICLFQLWNRIPQMDGEMSRVRFLEHNE